MTNTIWVGLAGAAAGVLILFVFLFCFRVRHYKQYRDSSIECFLKGPVSRYIESIRYIDYMDIRKVIKHRAVIDMESSQMLVCDEIRFLRGPNERRFMMTIWHDDSQSGYRVERIIFLRESDRDLA
jgi:hypothetical protein